MILRSLTILLLSLFWSHSLVLGQSRQVTLDPELKPFYHGVATGDPTSDAVIIWTRVTPDSSVSGPIVVQWQVAKDTSMNQVVKNGSVTTSASKDYTVKIDVTGLQPDTYYFYEFRALGEYSLRGRTKTTPAGIKDSLRFALVSCANWESGHFNVYGSIEERNDVDAIIHLGDYIYEYETGGYAPNSNTNREFQPLNEIVTLDDYRTRFSHYHLDKQLQDLHQQYPWMVIWDDHESANNSYKAGAENHDPSTEGSWNVRKDASMRAFKEWLPVREPDPTDDNRIFHTVDFGQLVDLILLDTRLYGRDEQAGTSGPIVNDPNRTMLGDTQYQWLENQLSNSTAQYKILPQQVMMAPLQVNGNAFNEDQWDGYPAERQRIYDHVLSNNIQNMVILTGDIHTSWANDLPTSSYDPNTGSGSAGVEFVCPSVTSPGSPIPIGVSAIKTANPHMKYIDLTQNGYIILDVNQNRVQSDWYYVETLDSVFTGFHYGESYRMLAGERHLEHVPAAAVPRPGLDHLQAPPEPRDVVPLDTTGGTGVKNKQKAVVAMGAYPNPFKDRLNVRFFLNERGKVRLSLFDMNGKEVRTVQVDDRPAGSHFTRISTDDLPSGPYFLILSVNGDKSALKVVRE